MKKILLSFCILVTMATEAMGQSPDGAIVHEGADYWWEIITDIPCPLFLKTYGRYQNGREQTRLHPSASTNNDGEQLLFTNGKMLWLNGAVGSVIFNYRIDESYIRLSNPKTLDGKVFTKDYPKWIKMERTWVKVNDWWIFTIDEKNTYRYFLLVCDDENE